MKAERKQKRAKGYGSAKNNFLLLIRDALRTGEKSSGGLLGDIKILFEGCPRDTLGFSSRHIEVRTRSEVVSYCS